MLKRLIVLLVGGAFVINPIVGLAKETNRTVVLDKECIPNYVLKNKEKYAYTERKILKPVLTKNLNEAKNQRNFKDLSTDTTSLAERLGPEISTLNLEEAKNQANFEQHEETTLVTSTEEQSTYIKEEAVGKTGYKEIDLLVDNPTEIPEEVGNTYNEIIEFDGPRLQTDGADPTLHDLKIDHYLDGNTLYVNSTEEIPSHIPNDKQGIQNETIATNDATETIGKNDVTLTKVSYKGFWSPWKSYSQHFNDTTSWIDQGFNVGHSGYTFAPIYNLPKNMDLPFSFSYPSNSPIQSISDIRQTLEVNYDAETVDRSISYLNNPVYMRSTTGQNPSTGLYEIYWQSYAPFEWEYTENIYWYIEQIPQYSYQPMKKRYQYTQYFYYPQVEQKRIWYTYQPKQTYEVKTKQPKYSYDKEVTEYSWITPVHTDHSEEQTHHLQAKQTSTLHSRNQLSLNKSNSMATNSKIKLTNASTQNSLPKTGSKASENSSFIGLALSFLSILGFLLAKQKNARRK